MIAESLHRFSDVSGRHLSIVCVQLKATALEIKNVKKYFLKDNLQNVPDGVLNMSDHRPSSQFPLCLAESTSA